MVEPKLNGYKCFYKGRSKEVYAENRYQAQQIAADLFKAKRDYEVTVILCELNGKQIVHSTSGL